MLDGRQGESNRPDEEPHGGGARRGACTDHSGLSGGQGDSASSSRTESLGAIRFQMAPTLRALGDDRITRPVAARQAGQIRHWVSQSRAGLAGGDTTARHVSLGRACSGGKARRQRACRLACSAARGNLSATAAQLVGEYRPGVCAQSRRCRGVISESPAQRRGIEGG
jgi:hypothetical protein